MPEQNDKKATSSQNSQQGSNASKSETTPSKNKAKSSKSKKENRSFVGKLVDLKDGLTDNLAGAYQFAAKTTEIPLWVTKNFLASPEQKKMMEEAGTSLRDLREVAGLTIRELADAIQLEDKSLLEAVESGTATLSFELILRISALLARHDPLPVVMKLTRTYNPALWKLLESWGVARLQLQFERERQFINIYRSHDIARKLSDEAFEELLLFTKAAFEMGLAFAAKQEGLVEEKTTNEDPPSDDNSPEKKKNTSPSSKKS